MSDRRLSSTAAMYSAGVFTFSCPFILTASSRSSRHRPGTTGPGPCIDDLARGGVVTAAGGTRVRIEDRLAMAATDSGVEAMATGRDKPVGR